jgi:hypothetical protein
MTGRKRRFVVSQRSSGGWDWGIYDTETKTWAATGYSSRDRQRLKARASTLNYQNFVAAPESPA